MSSRSGYLDCFMKFLQGQQGERLLPENRRGRKSSCRPPSLGDVKNSDSKIESSSNLDESREIPKVKDKIEKEKDVDSSQQTSSPPKVNPQIEMVNTPVVKRGRGRPRLKDKVQTSPKNDASELKGNGSLLLNEVNGEKDVSKDLLTCSEVKKDEKSAQNEPSDKPSNRCVDDLIKDPETSQTVEPPHLVDENTCTSNESSTDQIRPKGKPRGRKRKKEKEQKEEVPTRRLSSRKAKEKVNSYVESESEDNPHLDEESNSDDDPVWEPKEKKNESDDEDLKRKWDTHSSWKIKKTRSISPSKTISDPKEHIRKNMSEIQMKRVDSVRKSEVSNCNSEKTKEIELVVKRSSDSKPVDQKNLFSPYIPQVFFQSGTFIALKEDLEESEEPVIWRVDGKALLQKYEPFRDDDGRLKYRNVSTYSGWGPKDTAMYQHVPVKFIQQNKFETIVEIKHGELVINEEKLLRKLVNDYEKYGYAYEVYMQTLASQALDSKFLSEIVAEKDEYFLSSMNELDGLCEEKKNKLLKVFDWAVKLQESLNTWPIFNWKPYNKNSLCASCNKVSSSFIELDGPMYCKVTLVESAPTNSSFVYKSFAVCKTCGENMELFNKIAHLKYHTQKDCSVLVAKRKAAEPTEDNTSVLHEILADAAYITKKFHEVTLLWAQADLKSRTKKTEDITL